MSARSRAGLNAVYRHSLATADRLDRRRGTESAGVLARAWAVAKLAGLTLTAPVSVPAMGAIALRNRRVLDGEITDFAAVVEDWMDASATTDRDTAMTPGADPVATAGRRLATLPASGRYFVSSDLHRSPPGTNDLPHVQATVGPYLDALEHYHAAGWTLVENGDAEEFWLLGGSAYGVHYDVWRTVSGLLGRRGRSLRRRVAGEHLRRIVGNNAAVYRRLRFDFLEQGRYVRLSGNHDDVYDDHAGVTELRRWLPKVAVWDAVVLRDSTGPQAVITHGHLPDAWNAPGRNGLGKLAGVWASALYDTPSLRARPGVATPEETAALLAGTDPNRLVAVNPLLGAGVDLFTTDEVQLARSFRRRWPADGTEPAPLLLLGHTHAPRLAALDPEGRPWSDYLNGGSGVAHRLVTGLEWDGTRSPPTVTLVGWSAGPDGASRRVLRRLHRDGSAAAPAGGTPRLDGPVPGGT